MMRRIIATINMTIDGFCDHTAIDPDADIHEHYTNLIGGGDAILYGSMTYQLMQLWQPMIENPSGVKSMDDFAFAIDKIPKIVFSHSLKSTDGNSAQLANKSLEETGLEAKQKTGGDVFIGSRSLILQLANLNLIDEYQLCIHPIMA